MPETNGRTESQPRPPLVATMPLLGNTVAMSRDPAAFFVRCYLEYGPAFRIRVFGREQTVLAGAEAAEFMGTKQGRELLRSKEFWEGLVEEYGATRTISGQDGAPHQELRRIMRRGYGRAAAEGRYDDLVRVTDEVLDRDWKPGARVAVLPAMQIMVVEQLGLLLTGSAPREYVADIRRVIATILNVLVTKQRPRILLHDPRYRRSKRRVIGLGHQMASEWKRRGPLDSAHPSLVDDIMAANRDHPDLIPDSDLVLTLTGPYVAGLDTVANTLSAAVYAILSHPDVHARVTGEAEELLSTGIDGEALTHRATAINAAIAETMRLYPIAVAQMRTATADFQFAGYQVLADESLYLATSVPHFLGEYFPDPGRFDIDRYAKPRAEHQARGAYSPYGRGPHLCLGKSLAEVQMALCIAMLFGRRRLALPRRGYKLPTKTAPTPGPSTRFAVRVVDSRGPASR